MFDLLEAREAMEIPPQHGSNKKTQLNKSEFIVNYKSRCEDRDVKDGGGQLEEVSDCCHNLHAVENLNLEREGVQKP